jgi:multimeric flavodoxin WrbA
MKIISICGSTRRKGNTAELLRIMNKGLKESDLKVKKFSLADFHIEPCRACLKCTKKGMCVISDDFTKLAAKMLQSDIIILGSPVYFSDVSSPVKALIDRTVSLWHTKQLKGKKVILAATCAEYGSEHTIETMKLWAKDHEMDFISSVEGKGEKKEAVLMDEKALIEVKNSIELLKKNLSPES